MDKRSKPASPPRLVGISLVAACVLAPLAACQVIANIEDRSTPATLTHVDGSFEDGPAPGDDGGSLPPPAVTDATCALSHFEHAEQDASATDDETSFPPIIAAFSVVRLPGTVMSSSTDFPGYDLDNSCTCCDGGCSTANLPTCVNTYPDAGVTCDEPGGVDNATARLIDAYASVSSHFTEARINKTIATGIATVLLQIRGWNGLPNDDTVDLSFFDSPGATGPDGGLLGDAGTPKFDGHDTWSYASDGVFDTDDGGVPTDNPTFHSNQAYVADTILYGRLSSLDIVLGTLPLHLRDVAISGQLELNNGGYQVVSGVFSARWPTADALLQFGPTALQNCDLDGGGGFEYSLLKSVVCGAADLTSDPQAAGVGNGMTVPTAQCDSLSLQLGFESVAAQFGGPMPPIGNTNPCPGYADTCP